MLRIFLRTKNGCYIQISGVPISEHIYRSNIPKNTNSSTIKSVSVNGSTCINRGSIFYCRKYSKYPGLPRSHIFSQKSANVETLVIKIFPFIHSSSSQFPGISPTFVSALHQLCYNLYTNYKKLSVHTILSIYTSISKNTNYKSPSVSVTTSELRLKLKSKSKRRGCRAGKAKKSNQKTFMPSSFLSSSNSTEETYHVSNKRLKITTTNTHALAMTTTTSSSSSSSSCYYNSIKITDRIIDTALQNIEQDTSLICQGYSSQEKTCYDSVNRNISDFSNEKYPKYNEFKSLSLDSDRSSLEVGINNSNETTSITMHEKSTEEKKEGREGEEGEDKEEDALKCSHSSGFSGFHVNSPFPDSSTQDSGNNYHINARKFLVV